MLKKNILFPGVTLMLCSLTAGVMAFSAGTENWDVDGLNGGVTVNATLTDSPCSLAEESAEQKVFMGDLPQWRFTKPGALSETVPVHLILEHCLFDGQVRATEHGDSLYWFKEQPVVMMNVIGDEEPTNPHLFRTYGEAKGIALKLEDSAHHPIYPGERTRPQLLNPGRNDLIINAQISRTINALELGDFNSVINVGLEYF